MLNTQKPKGALVHRMRGKFGKVYLTSKANPGKLNEIDSAAFSNLDLKWYTTEGEIHPEWERLQGKNFTYQFNFQNKDINGRKVEFTGRYVPCYKLGEMPATDVEHLELADTTVVENAKFVKLVSEHEGKRLAKLWKDCTGCLATVLTPGWPVMDQRILLIFLPAMYVVDDMVLKLCQGKSHNRLQEIAKAIGDVMRGKRTWQDNADGNAPDVIRPFLHATALMREDALRCVSEEEGQDMFECFAEHIASFAVENCVEWIKLEHTESAIFRRGQEDLRYINAGGKIVMEMVLVNCGIVVNREIRDSFLFKHFYNMYERQVSTVNDFMSFRKECADGETCNYTYLLHAVEGLPLEEALQRTVDEINSLTQQIVKLGDMLHVMFADKKEVGQFVELAKGIIQGHYQFYTYSLRYHPTFVLDCIVEDD